MSPISYVEVLLLIEMVIRLASLSPMVWIFLDVCEMIIRKLLFFLFGDDNNNIGSMLLDSNEQTFLSQIPPIGNLYECNS